MALDEEQVRDHYDRGDDFYGWFLGPRMIYTSGIISDINKEETLEQLQDNKLGVVCQKIGLKGGESLLDIGCGWGTLAKYASTNYGAHTTGVTLGRNQTAWGNNALRKAGIEESQSRILCMDYRDIPVPSGGYNKITCLEMAEHVGVKYFSTFLKQVYDMLDDDGVFFLQIAGIRKCWQYEDLIWGLFMNKYIFPGADASTPLGWFVDKLEGAGFEIKGIDTIGVHYSATLWRWYRNWMANKEKIEAKYGNRWFRVRSFLFSLPLSHSLSIKNIGLYLSTRPNIPLTTDLGIFPRLVDHRLPPGLSDMLSDHLGQEHQLHPPHRGCPESIWPLGRPGRVQGSQRGRSGQECCGRVGRSSEAGVAAVAGAVNVFICLLVRSFRLLSFLVFLCFS